MRPTLPSLACLSLLLAPLLLAHPAPQSFPVPSACCSIVGAVEDDAGNALPRARVEVLPSASAPAADPPHASAVYTTSDGSFRLSLPPGQYRLAATHQGHFKLAESELTVTVQPLLDHPPVRLRLQRSGVVTGTVRNSVGDPLPGVTVSAAQTICHRDSPKISFRASAVTDDRGVYRIYHLQPGSYTIFAATPVSQPPSPWSVASQFFSMADQLVNATPVTVLPGQESSSIDFRLADVTTSNLRVSVDGALPQRILLLALHQGLASPFGPPARPDRSGTYLFPSVPAGEYALVAWLFDANRKPLAVGATTAVVRGHGGEETVKLPMTAVSDFKGRIVCDPPCDPKQLGSLSVEIAGENFAAKFTGAEFASTVVRDHAFLIPSLPAGTYRVSVAGLPPQYYVRRISSPGQPDAVNHRIQIRAAAATPEFQIEITPRSPLLVVEVLDAHGNTPSGGHIRLESLSPPADPRLYDLRSGKVTIGSLSPGEYRLTFRSAAASTSCLTKIDAPAASATFLLREGEQRSLRLEVP